MEQGSIPIGFEGILLKKGKKAPIGFEKFEHMEKEEPVLPAYPLSKNHSIDPIF